MQAPGVLTGEDWAQLYGAPDLSIYRALRARPDPVAAGAPALAPAARAPALPKPEATVAGPGTAAEAGAGRLAAAGGSPALAPVRATATREQRRRQDRARVAARRERVREMFEDGARREDMAIALGVSPATITGDLRALGLRLNCARAGLRADG